MKEQVMSLAQAIKEPVKNLLLSVLAQVGEWLPVSGVPILTYHSLDESGSTISMSPSSFKQQMHYLKAHGFETISLSDFVERLKSGNRCPEKAFVLTFDDGFKNVYEIAFPILSELDFGATIFLPTDYVGKNALWELGEKDRKAGLNRLHLLSWSEVDELQRHGFEFGSHGAGHLRLTQIDRALVRSDIEKSKQAIEDRLGIPCRLFCYPYGDFDESVQRTVQEKGFEGAVTLEFGRNNGAVDPYVLRRIGSAYFTNAKAFRSCIYGTYGWHSRKKKRS